MLSLTLCPTACQAHCGASTSGRFTDATTGSCWHAYLQAQQRFDSQDIDPQHMLSAMRSDEELMELMSKPHVADALYRMQADPSKSLVLMQDPDVHALMNKMRGVHSSSTKVLRRKAPDSKQVCT